MAEAVGLVASIVGLAAFGTKLSMTLYEYGDTMVHAREQIDSIANEITSCSSALQQVGSVLEAEEATYSPALVSATKRLVLERKNKFHEIRAKIKHKNRHRGKGFRRLEWLFDKPKAKRAQGRAREPEIDIDVDGTDRDAGQSGNKLEYDVDQIRTQLWLLKSLLIANHHSILILEVAEKEAAYGLGPAPPHSSHRRSSTLKRGNAKSHGAPAQPVSHKWHQGGPAQSVCRDHEIANPVPKDFRQVDDTVVERGPTNLAEGPKANEDHIVAASDSSDWQDHPVVMVDPKPRADGTDDTYTDDTYLDASTNISFTSNPSPKPASDEEPQEAPYDLPPTHWPHTVSSLLYEVVPSGYSTMFRQPALLTGHAHHMTEGRRSDAEKEAANKWTKTGSSYVAAFINKSPERSEKSKTESNESRVPRQVTPGLERSTNTGGENGTSESSKDSDNNPNSRSTGVATAGAGSGKDDNILPRSKGSTGSELKLETSEKRAASSADAVAGKSAEHMVDREAAAEKAAIKAFEERRNAETAATKAMVNAEAFAAEEIRLSNLTFEAWKPPAGSPVTKDDEYDILDLLTRKHRGGIVWSRGNNARLALFVGPSKFLTVELLPSSGLGGEEMDQYTQIGKEWVRREVLELFNHSYVEKEATFYQVLHPLTFPQVESLVRVSFQLLKDSYVRMARTIVAEKTTPPCSVLEADDEKVLASSGPTTPVYPTCEAEIATKGSRSRPQTSVPQNEDKDPHLAPSPI
ncbi:hypothetical protein MMC13_004301 [Lambiella insularis]|nr:hypothetical protein [Lambiella insularis]